MLDSKTGKTAGVLLPITSLPSPYGIGDLGPCAIQFARTISRLGFSWWQILPTQMVGLGNSPYASPSAFGGGPLLISPDDLAGEDLLTEEELSHAQEQLTSCDPQKVNYQAVREVKFELFEKAWHRFSTGHHLNLAYSDFVQHNGHWLSPLVKFQANKSKWPIEYFEFLQFIFHYQFAQLKKELGTLNISLMGDLPLFLSPDGVEVSSPSKLFKRDQKGQFSAQCGVPPDLFSATGQCWATPNYDWEEMKQDNFSWWIKRLEYNLSLCDALRIDHFLGMHHIWEIPWESTTATEGGYVKTPGFELLSAAKEKLGKLSLVAEDLGAVTAEAIKLRDHFNLPGMRVIQFAFNPTMDDYLIHRPANYTENSVVYSGTHDNDTLVGFLDNLNIEEKQELKNYLPTKLMGADSTTISRFLISDLLSSKSQLVILAAQDLMGLDSSARINHPGTSESNWEWRLTKNQLIQMDGHLGWVKEMLVTTLRTAGNGGVDG